MKKMKKIIGIICIVSFAITALTSVPLFINYLNGITPSKRLMIDLHVWFGALFIVIGSIRMIKNKAFIKGGDKK